MRIVVANQDQTEPVISIRLKPRPELAKVHGNYIDLVGSLPGGPEWLIATFEGDSFQPNKNGCEALGLKINNRFNKQVVG